MTLPSQQTSVVLARSWPLLARRRRSLELASGRYAAALARADGAVEGSAKGLEGAPNGRARAARALLGWLLDRVAGAGTSAPPGAIDSRDFAAFGDGLAAVLRDTLGAEASPAMLSAWGDAYWAWARAAQPRALALAA